MKCPLHCTSLGAKLDSNVAQAPGVTFDHHLWSQSNDRVNTLAPLVGAGDLFMIQHKRIELCTNLSKQAFFLCLSLPLRTLKTLTERSKNKNTLHSDG